MQVRKVPSTPAKVLEESKKVAYEVVGKISEGEKIYTKVVEVVSTIREALLEDETRENIKEDARQDEDKIKAAKGRNEEAIISGKSYKYGRDQAATTRIPRSPCPRVD